MFTHIRAASLTLQAVLTRSFRADHDLATMFDPILGGKANVSLATPDGMESAAEMGLSMWLYRLIRDDQTLNQPPRRIDGTKIRHQPLPLRAHYLMTPIITGNAGIPAPEAEQLIIGRTLQTFHDEPLITDPDLTGSYQGSGVQLGVRLETLGLDETSRIWEGLERSYQLSVSYEVAIVVIGSGLRTDRHDAGHGGDAGGRDRRAGGGGMSLLPVIDPVSGWRLSAEPPQPVAVWPQQILRVAVVDEITGAPPQTLPLASTTTPGVVACATGPLAGLRGSPLALYQPGFVTGAALQLGLAGTGFLPIGLSGTIGAEPGYPDAFQPLDLGQIALHRAPVSIRGRTVSAHRVARAGSLVTLDGYWAAMADLANPPVAPNLVSLATPLNADRAAGATVTAVPMTAGASATLLNPANVGDTSILLSNQAGLAVGQVVALDAADPGRADYPAVASLTNLGAGPAFPTVVGLTLPLIRPHALGAVATQMSLGAAGTANGVTAEARAGDVTLVTAAVAGLPTPPTAPSGVAIAGGGTATVEYNMATLIGGVSDVQGYVALPPVHRAAQLRLRAHNAAEPTDLLFDVLLPLGAGALTLDFVFPP